ncbi:uncharacterized protein LOC129767014 [Toxorhynchites rutilus septentrionalis]|uniref:uncharacterized protein LOC129767014 n=1 Tax=Toxorhynchites rutilus septentrionalis TaxID=329112 RepID=UPI002479DCBA|nr:uncharacterized protein LOC129767014 [Toxorhynchites rutilus septentrionalis]
MNISCVICNDSPEKSLDCVLLQFPDNVEQPVLYQKYITICDLDEATLPNKSELFICSMHFEPECFEDGSEQHRLREEAIPSLNLERIEIEAYVDEEFQMLDEYVPLFNIKQTAPSESVEDTIDTTNSPIIPKIEPLEEVQELFFEESEVKTEAPDLDEEVPDPFDSVEHEPSPNEDSRYCIICKNSESENQDCRLYVFPRKIPSIYHKWMLAAGLDAEDYKTQDIYSCQRHFPENGFFADGKFVQSWAIPNLNMPTGNGSSDLQIAKESSKPNQTKILNASAKTSTAENKTDGVQIVIKSNPMNRKNAEALNIDPDSYAKTFAKVVSELVPRTLNYNGEERPVTGTIVFESNLF